MKSSNRFTTLIAAAAFATLALGVQAQQAPPADVEVSADPEFDNSPSAGAMAFDLVVVRPLSLVGTLLGSGLFILQMPLALIQGKPPTAAAKKLVVEPAHYTFDRPLGQMD